MTTTTSIEYSGTKLLTVMIVSGVLFSGMTFFMLSDGFSSSLLSEKNYQMLCDTGLCVDSSLSFPTSMFVQQNQGFDSFMAKNNESFSAFRAAKTSVLDVVYDDNSAILFSSKDSFVREGLQTSNEGSNEVLRVMGTGPTNNRALIAFDNDQLSDVLKSKSIDSATLRIFVVDTDNQWNKGDEVIVRSLTEDWTEGIGSNAPFGSLIGTQKGVTWSCSSDSADCDSWNGGSFQAVISDSVPVPNDISGKWLEFDVTDDVLSILDGSPNYGWIVMKSDEDSSGRINIAARETQTNIPQLELTFT